MTGASPWAAPPETGPQQAPAYPPAPAAIPPQSGPPVPGAPPPRPSRRFPSLLIGGAVVLLVAVIVATAAVTYAVARNTSASNASPGTATATPAPPQFSEADRDAAKQQLCQVFDASTRGQQGQGGVRIDGEPNIPLMLRSLNSVVAVQTALVPATPQDLANAAHRYVDANLKLTTAVTGTTPIEEVNRLNGVANTATFAFADACGLPH